MKTPLMIVAMTAALLLGSPRLLAQEAGPPENCPQPEACQCDGNAGECTQDGDGDGTCGGTCLSLDNIESDGTQTVSDEYLARLQSVLESEYYARDYYEAASEALGGIRQFDRLALAEQRHADAVTNMIRIVGGVAVTAQTVQIVPPTSVEQAEAECEVIELYVIDVYADLIADCTDDHSADGSTGCGADSC